jgi:hypothetical protein
MHPLYYIPVLPIANNFFNVSSPLKLLNGMAGFWVAIFRFTSNNALIPTVSKTAMCCAVLTTRPKLAIMACNSGSSFGSGCSIAARNRLGFFPFKCRTQPTRFNHRLGSAFSSASLTLSLSFFLICSNLSAVIFCTFAHISGSGSLSLLDYFSSCHLKQLLLKSLGEKLLTMYSRNL